MPIPAPYKRIRTSNADLNRVQDAVQATFASLNLCPLLDGVLLRDVSIPNVNTKVPHTLGRVPLGYIVTKSNVDVHPYLVEDPDANFLTLFGQFQAVFDLYVF